MALTIETLFEDTDLRARWMSGSSRRVVVAFTGLRNGFGDMPSDEFAASASQGGVNNVLFISDLNQSWYSRPGLWDRIVTLINDVVKLEEITEVVTLGNSMGGFGALLLPRDVVVKRAIAFSPQVSMDPDVIDEDRWDHLRPGFGTLPVSNVSDAITEWTEYFTVIGRDAPKDLAQSNLLPNVPHLRRWIMPGAGHNLAKRLKASGILPRLIAALIEGKRFAANALFDEYRAWCATLNEGNLSNDQV